ncbi:MAG: YigZ family protein [Clostridia bacterium]
MKTSFHTIKTQTSATLTEKKSVFLAHSFLVQTEHDAALAIQECKKKYWDATHNVYAYYLGAQSQSLQDSPQREQPLQKFSDDGEPSGTAGLPVLETIRKRDLENVLLVVTRYFGGVPLRAPGLVRAYGKAASLCLDASAVTTMTLCQELICTCAYPQLEKIQQCLAPRSLKQTAIDYAEDVVLTLQVPVDEVASLCAALTDVTNGQILINIHGKNSDPLAAPRLSWHEL